VLQPVIFDDRGDPSQRYDGVSQFLHWLTAVTATVPFILGPGGFGRLMRQGVDPASRSDIVWHESLGVLVFLLTLTRLLWIATATLSWDRWPRESRATASRRPPPPPV